MTHDTESRLLSHSSKEVVKRAKHLLKSGFLLCCYQGDDGLIHAVFADRKNLINRVELFGVEGVEKAEKSPKKLSSKCTCGSNSGKLCPHAVAAAMSFYEHSDKVPQAPLQERPARYAGLKYEDLPELTAKTVTPPRAELVLNVESAFPHVPSKWERTLLKVTLKYGTREYVGTLSNLRQLHFGKSMAASLQISYFSLQDRQIIRFLAICAEPEDSKLAIDAEQTAEFFHCLSGFENFYHRGEKVVVHREIAEPVLICEKANGEYRLHTSIMIKGAFMPLKSAKVITGRSGCWLGIKGEYWWIPATVDVSWLRSFLRTTVQPCDRQSAEMLLAGKLNLPIKVIAAKPEDLKQHNCRIVYAGDFDHGGKFELELNFDYDGRIFSADGARLAITDGKFWKRNHQLESRVVEELESFGFTHINGNGLKSVFVLNDIEAAGVFMDKILPIWMSEEREFYISSRLAAISNGGRGLNDIHLNCKIIESNSDFYKLRYLLSSSGRSIAWKELLGTIDKNRNYIYLGGFVLARISPELSKFVRAVRNLVHTEKAIDDVLRIPRFSATYWAEVGVDMPEAVPPEFFELRKCLKEIGEKADSEELQGDGDLKPVAFKGDLRKYQQQGILWMRQLARRDFNLILADEMGLGKTIQALAVLAKENHKGTPSLILCPTSLVENWQRETERFVPGFKVLTISGPDREKLWKSASKYDLIISSYALSKRDLGHFRRMKFNYLILDEAQHIKNPFTANAKTCKSIRSEHRLVLTGTPLENSPEDLWSIFDFLHPGMLGSYQSFKLNYNDIDKNHDRQEDLAARVSPFILRRKKKEVYSELPPKHEQVLYCELSDAQRKIYEEYLEIGRNQCKQLFKNKSKNNMEFLTTLLRLRQICCHPGLLPLEDNPDVRDSAKTELMQELLFQIVDSGHKVLLFSQFTSLLKIIREWLDAEKIRYEYLDGSTKNRMDHVDNFNNSPEIPIFLLSLKAGGTGLNLTSADSVIIYDPWWNPAVETQAADRSHRIGQTKPVNMIKLVVKNSIEERIIELQRKKQNIFQSLVDNPAVAFKNLDSKDFKFLLQG